MWADGDMTGGSNKMSNLKLPEMNNNRSHAPFCAEDVDWNELASIGILKDELEMAGELLRL